MLFLACIRALVSLGYNDEDLQIIRRDDPLLSLRVYLHNSKRKK